MPDDEKSVELDQSLFAFQTSLARAREANNATQICLFLKKCGQIYLEKEDAPKALTCFEEALQIAKQIQEKETEAQLFGYKGLALKMLGNYGMALESFQKSNGIASSLHQPVLVCDALMQMAVLETDLNENQKAVDNLVQALEITEKNSDSQRKMRILSLLGDNYYALGDFDKAEKYYLTAYEIAGNVGNRSAECSFLTKRGNVSLRKGDKTTAIEQYEGALVIASELENRSAEINVLGGLFRANALGGDAGLATFYGERVIQLAHEINYFEAEIINIHALSTFLLEQKDFDKALSYLERARQLAEENQSPDWLLTILTIIGQAYYDKGENEQSLEVFSRVLHVSQMYSEKGIEAKTLGYIGSILADTKRFDEAHEQLQLAIDIAQELGDLQLIGNDQMLLALNYREQDDLQNAIQYCKAAVETYQKIPSQEMVEQADALLAELESQQR